MAVLQSLSGRACPWYSIRFVNRRNNKFTQKVIDPSTLDSQDILSIEVLQAHQEMTSIALWNPVASVVFASSMLPIVSTQTSVPRNLGTQGNYLISGGHNSNLLPILSDFAIAVDANNQYRPMVEYNPGAEYRFIDMNLPRTSTGLTESSTGRTVSEACTPSSYSQDVPQASS